MDVTILCFGGFQTIRLHEVVAQRLIAAVDPQTAVAAQRSVAAPGGIVAADVLAVGQSEAHIMVMPLRTL